MRKISLASTRVEIAKGASEMVVDDFIDSHLQERPKTRPEIALTPAELAELRAGKPASPEPVGGTPVSRTDVRGLLEKRDERISHLEDELIALRRELDHIRRASGPSGEQGFAAPLPMLDEPLDEAPRDASAWRRVPPPTRPLGAGVPPRAKPSRPGASAQSAGPRDPRAEPDDEPTLEDSGTHMRSETLLDETLRVHSNLHGAPPPAGSSLAPKTDVAAALLGAEPPAVQAASSDIPAALSLDVPAVFQFGAPEPAPDEALRDSVPAVLQFGPTPDPGPAIDASARGAAPQGVVPGLPEVSMHPVTPASSSRAPWLIFGGLITLLALAGGAVALGWVVLPWATTSDERSDAATIDAEATIASPSVVVPPPEQRPAPSAAPTPSAAPEASGAPAASAAPTPSAAPEASGAPAASAAPTPPPAMPEKDPSLLSFQAFLTVSSSVDAEVVVQGVGVGRTNQKLLVRCGPRNLRLRATGGAWLSEGTHAKIECMHHTTLHVPATLP